MKRLSQYTYSINFRTQNSKITMILAISILKTRKKFVIIKMLVLAYECKKITPYTLIAFYRVVVATLCSKTLSISYTNKAASTRIRTSDLRLRRPLLYPLSYERSFKSGWQDLNLRSPGPKPGALATRPHPDGVACNSILA